MKRCAKYRWIIFDLDDTIIDNRRSVRRAFDTMMKAALKSPNEADFQKWLAIDKKFWRDRQDGKINIPAKFANETGRKSDDFLDWLRAQRFLIFFENSISLDRAIQLCHIYTNALADDIVAIPKAREILKNLYDKHYKILVATNGPSAVAMKKLEQISCAQFVAEVFPADRFGCMKPNPVFFTEMQRELDDFDRDHFLIIGDSLKSDVGLGMNCDFDSCWFNRTNEPLPDEYKPTFEIHNLEQLTEML